jgi:uncharacterized iron-regulated membrane protein
MQIKYELNPPAKATNLLRKLVALVVTAAMVGLVLMFSAVLLVIILVVGTIAGIYLWWKTRELRKQIREFSTREMAREKQTGGDDVFEGEVIRVLDPRNEK